MPCLLYIIIVLLVFTECKGGLGLDTVAKLRNILLARKQSSRKQSYGFLTARALGGDGCPHDSECTVNSGTDGTGKYDCKGKTKWEPTHPIELSKVKYSGSPLGDCMNPYRCGNDPPLDSHSGLKVGVHFRCSVQLKTTLDTPESGWCDECDSSGFSGWRNSCSEFNYKKRILAYSTYRFTDEKGSSSGCSCSGNFDPNKNAGVVNIPNTPDSNRFAKSCNPATRMPVAAQTFSPVTAQPTITPSLSPTTSPTSSAPTPMPTIPTRTWELAGVVLGAFVLLSTGMFCIKKCMLRRNNAKLKGKGKGKGKRKGEGKGKGNSKPQELASLLK